MKKYIYKGREHSLKQLESTLGRTLTRKELLTLQSEGECSGITTTYKIPSLYRRPVRGNIVVFRLYQGQILGLCPIKGRQSDHLVPCYDTQWRWVDYHHLVRNSDPCTADDHILEQVEKEYGKSRVVTRCRPAYPINDRVKRRYVRKPDTSSTPTNADIHPTPIPNIIVNK